jgi:ADP-ribosylglycohydrolase
MIPEVLRTSSPGRERTKTTHAAREAVDACRYCGGLIAGAVGGRSKEELLAEPFEPLPGIWEADPLAPKIAAIAAGSYKRKNPPEIRGTGYVVDCLEAALWAFHRSTTFREGALLAVNLGDDADITGAVYSQLAGAFYGEEEIPKEWRSVVALREKIAELAEALLRLNSPPAFGEAPRPSR